MGKKSAIIPFFNYDASPKNFLYKIWNLSKQDFCQLPDAELLESDLIFFQVRKTFQRKSNEKVSVRNIIKYQMKELVKEFDQGIWRYLVNNEAGSQMPGRLEGWNSVINQTLQTQLKEIKFGNFEFLVDALINEFS